MLDWFTPLWIALCVGAALLSALLALVGLVLDPVRAAWRRRRVRRHPLDPSLRALVASETSWEQAAALPELAGEALPALRVLTDDWGFDLPRVGYDGPTIEYRRGDVGLSVAHGVTDRGPEVMVLLVLFRTPASRVVVAAEVRGSRSHGMGDGFRGVAFYLQMHLDEWIEALRAEAAEALGD